MRGDERIRQALSAVCLSEVSTLRSVVGREFEQLEAVELEVFSQLATPVQRQWVDWWRREGRSIESHVDGRALRQLGIAEGPAIGRAKEAALDSARDGASAEEQLARARVAAGAEP